MLNFQNPKPKWLPNGVLVFLFLKVKVINTTFTHKFVCFVINFLLCFKKSSLILKM